MLLVDARGVPLSLIVIGANRHDVTQLCPVLDSLVIARPGTQHAEHLCADAGFFGEPRSAPSANGATPRMCDRASRKSGGASKGIRRADGSWRLLIRGLTASANSWYVTRRLTGPTLRSTCSPPPSSAFEKCRQALILFTDKL